MTRRHAVSYFLLYLVSYNFICCSVWEGTLSLTLKGGHRRRVFENRVMRIIFGSNRRLEKIA
jgi:hypothetical protein